jgi:Uma2 family endonuclease
LTLLRIVVAQTLTEERQWTHQRARNELEESTRPTEILGGQLVMSPTPSFYHQIIVSRLTDTLRRWVKRRELGIVVSAPLDVVLAPDLVLQPDVIFISKKRTHIIQQHIHGAPDLAIEVVSPDRRKRDYQEKKNYYEAHGVLEYWIVDAELPQIEVWILNRNRRYELGGRFSSKQKVTSTLLKGFSVAVSDIFADPLKG